MKTAHSFQRPWLKQPSSRLVTVRGSLSNMRHPPRRPQDFSADSTSPLAFNHWVGWRRRDFLLPPISRRVCFLHILNPFCLLLPQPLKVFIPQGMRGAAHERTVDPSMARGRGASRGRADIPAGAPSLLTDCGAGCLGPPLFCLFLQSGSSWELPSPLLLTHYTFMKQTLSRDAILTWPVGL